MVFLASSTLAHVDVCIHATAGWIDSHPISGDDDASNTTDMPMTLSGDVNTQENYYDVR
jgi:hypothetical protein